MQPLYHYTSIETIFSILEKFKEKDENDYLTFWATHSFYMNDPLEYKRYAERLKKKVQEYGKKNNNEVSDEELNEIFNEQNQYLAPYIISFSTKGDNLNMWRAYGDNGKGVCLEFDFSDCELDKDYYNSLSEHSVLTEEDVSILKSHEIVPCNYNYDIVIDESFIREVYENIKKKDMLSKCANNIKISNNAIQDKQNSYKDESEVRIIKNRIIGEENFRLSSNGLLIPYIEVKIPIKCLKKIIVMPSIYNLQAASLKRYLLNNKLISYNIQIEVSQIQYRPDI